MWKHDSAGAVAAATAGVNQGALSTMRMQRDERRISGGDMTALVPSLQHLCTAVGNAGPLSTARSA